VHAQAGRLGDGAQDGDRRSLAVGAGDMNHRRQPALGIAERRAQAVHPPQRQVDQLGMQQAKPLKRGVMGSKVV